MTERDVTQGATEDKVLMQINTAEHVAVAKNLLENFPRPCTLSITPPKASDELTSRMHCAIRCIAKQLTWAGERLNEEDWKRLLVAGIFGQRVLPSTTGKGFVVLDRRTGRMSGTQKYDLTEFIYAFGAERGVVFDEQQE